MKDKNKILDTIEAVCGWLIMGLLCFIGLGLLPVKSTNLADYALSLFYFAYAVIVCPKMPLQMKQRYLLIFIFYFYGIWAGLI